MIRHFIQCSRPTILMALCALTTLAPASKAAFVALPQQGTAQSEPDIAEGYKLYEEKKYQQAAQIFERAAKEGKVNGMFALGLLYQEGNGLEKDLGKSESWYQKAADKGHGPSMYNLSQIMLGRNGGQEKGLALLKKAADGGLPLAMMNYGQLLGKGIPGILKSDLKECRNVLAKSLEAGSAESAYQLGLAWEAAQEGAPADMTKAMSFYERAADSGQRPAMLLLADKFLKGQGVAKDEAKARKWLEKAVELKSGAAMFVLGQLYEDGLGGLKQDRDKALSLYHQALEVPEQDRQLLAYNKIAYFYEQGWSTAKDEKKAVEWYQKGAEKGVSTSKYNLGVMLEDGRGTAKDSERAFKLILEAAREGLAAAQVNIAQRYRTGRGVAMDPVAAMAWMDRAARTGVPQALLTLAEMHLKGEAGQPEPNTAAQIYKQGVSQGMVEAKMALAEMLEGGRGIEADPTTAYALYLNVSKLDPGKNENAIKVRDAASKKVTDIKPRLTPDQIKQAEEMQKKPETNSSATGVDKPAAQPPAKPKK